MAKQKVKSGTTGKNKTNLTVQQIKFLEFYLDIKSETFGNALQSALRAGYRQEYAESITHIMPKWLSENLGDLTRLKKAEVVLDKTLEMQPIDTEGKLDNQLLKTQTDVAKFIASTLGKMKYSNKGEESVAKLAESILGMRIVEDNGDNIQN